MSKQFVGKANESMLKSSGDPGSLLSRAAVAQKLGVCPHTIQRLTRRGLLPAIVFNRRLIRYAPEEVENFIKAAVVK